MENQVQIQGLVSSLDGRRVFKAAAACGVENVEETGRDLALQLLKAGAADILEEIRLLGD